VREDDVLPLHAFAFLSPLPSGIGVSRSTFSTV
jgi:hypothetical protein